jgi:hypothetical protein
MLQFSVARRPLLPLGVASFLLLAGLFAACAAASAARAPRGARVARAELSWSIPEVVGSSAYGGEAASLDSIACPSTRLCVATDRDGTLVVSRAPGGGAAGWHQIPLGAGADLVAVACPTASLCLVAARDGRLFTSTAPARAGSWRASAFVGMAAVTGLACAPRGACVATDDAGDVAATPSPAAPAGAWNVQQVDGATQPCGRARCQVALSGITCPAASLCLALDSAGALVRSESPAAGSASWQTEDIDGGGPALTPPGGPCKLGVCASISCAGTSSCVAVDSGGQVLTTPEPDGPSTAWAIHPTGARGEPVAVACPTALSCQVADDAGQILSTSQPSGGSAAFTATQVEPRLGDGLPAARLSAVACPSPSECVATDTRGRILIARRAG